MISENEIRSRPYLKNYDIALQIKSFFADFVGKTSEYVYVSAAERRCFNLACTFFSEEQKQNLVSNSGLMMYHRELAQQYLQDGTFPRILLLDDLVIHGRGLSKFVAQLESSVEDDLLELLAGDEKRDNRLRGFHRRLTQSIDVIVFAQNKNPLLLDDRYLYRVKSQYMLSARELHDLSWQLSDCMTRWPQANTCFAYSEHNPELWDRLVHGPSFSTIAVEGWTQLAWEYAGESMGLFLSADQSAKMDFGSSCVSSIRFFPGRLKQQWFTSFTFWGDFPESRVQQISLQVAERIREEGFSHSQYIIRLLTDTSRYSSSAKGQLLSFLLSTADYRSFLASVPDFSYRVPDAEWLRKNSDIEKISRNFGKLDDVISSMTELLTCEPWMKSVHELLLEEIRQYASPLCSRPLSGSREETSEAVFAKYNRVAEELFYEVGIEAERDAARCFYNVSVFQPFDYQEYSSRTVNSGIRSLTDFFCAYEAPDTNDFYYQTAAMIHMMDIGLLGVLAAEVRDADAQIFLCKAGEMSTIYGPSRISAAIPALALLESSCTRLHVSLKELIDRFLVSLDTEDFYTMVSQNEEVQRYCKSPEFQKFKRMIPIISRKIYYGNQRIAEWNFYNLTGASFTGLDNDVHEALQKAMYRMAELQVI